MLNILIETPRLIMREFTIEDSEAVLQFSQCARVSKYTGDANIVNCEADALKVINDVWLTEYKKNGYARYALIHKASNKVIGFCGFKYDEELGCPDIGYRMLPEYWGQGLGKEALEATLTYGKKTLGLSYIIGDVVEENIASRKLLIGAGMTLKETVVVNNLLFNRYEMLL